MELFPDNDGRALAEAGTLRLPREGSREEWFCVDNPFDDPGRLAEKFTKEWQRWKDVRRKTAR